MKKRPHIIIVLLVILLFGVAWVYSFFDVLVEADFLSGKKYEDRDVEEVYAEKQSNPVVGTMVGTIEDTMVGVLTGAITHTGATGHSSGDPQY